MFLSGLKTWIFKWMKNGFLSARGEAVKNAGIIRCTSIQLNIRACYPQKIRLQYVKGHSGDVGNDGADAMANRGTLLPEVEERDWEALEMKLSEQLQKSHVETNGVEPAPMEVQDRDDVENTVTEIPASLSARQDKTGVTAVSQPQSMPLESRASVSSTNLETIQDKVSLKVMNASICASEVDFDVGELAFKFIIYISHFNRIMRIVYWMMEILPRNFLTRFFFS